MRTMQAKCRGTCRDCGGIVMVGDTIRWSKDTGAIHEDSRVCRDEIAFRAAQRGETDGVARTIYEDEMRWETEATAREMQWEAEMTAREEYPMLAEVGGAFDGFTVTSDADPGL